MAISMRLGVTAMKIDLSSLNTYAIDGLTKNSNSSFIIEGYLNSNGNIIISNGNNELKNKQDFNNYSISCKGNINISNGYSVNDIYYSGALNKGESWDSNLAQEINFNNIPGLLSKLDLEGYLEYLMSLDPTGNNTFTSNILTLRGTRTKSINCHNVDELVIEDCREIRIPSGSATSHLIKIESIGNVNITDLVMTDVGVKPSSANIIFTSTSNNISIANSIIKGSIYAPKSNITIHDSEIKGFIVCKTLTIIGTGSTVIRNDSFIGYIQEPKTPEIKIDPESSIGNYDPLTIEISSDIPVASYYKIKYTLDGSVPDEQSLNYIAPFNLFIPGIVTIKAKLFGSGVPDGNLTSNAYGFSCKTPNPSLKVNEITKRYYIETSPDSIIYYTLDGSTPTRSATLYNQSEFEVLFDEEGLYYLRFFSVSEGCDDSDIVDENIVVELPNTGINPPVVNIHKNGILLYSIIPTPNTEIDKTLNRKKHFVFGRKPVGEAADPDVIELLTSENFTVSDMELITITLTPSHPSNTIKYSVNGDNPVSGSEYTTPITFASLNNGSIRAFSYLGWNEYSQQINYIISFRTTNSVNFDNEQLEDRSAEVLDSLQGGANYATDIAWIGPGVVTDDFAVYQALINILATDMFERVFNPRFGVSISTLLAEVGRIKNGSKIINDLKEEIEIQDPRIQIKENLSYVNFDDSIGAVVIRLVWMNTLTKNTASLKYAYDLDALR